MNEFLPHGIDEECTYESGLLGHVKAGFPSPAENIHEKLDLIRLLVRHRASTFFFRLRMSVSILAASKCFSG